MARLKSPQQLEAERQEARRYLLGTFRLPTDKLLLIYARQSSKMPQQELTEDLLSIITAFAGRLYGMRSHKQKALVACAQAVLHNS